MKGVVEFLLDGLRVGWTLEVPAEPPLHPGRSGIVTVAGRRAGVFRELHPLDASRLGLTGRVAVAELDVSSISAEPVAVTFRDVPRFPPVRRDLAFVVPAGVSAGMLQAALDDAGGSLLDRSRSSTSSRAARSRRAARAWPSLSSSGRPTGRSPTTRSSRWCPRSSTECVRSSGRSSGPEVRITPMSAVPLDSGVMRHYLSVDGLSAAELPELIDLGAALKANPERARPNAGRPIDRVDLRKPSTRTCLVRGRVEQLGAHAVVLSRPELSWSR